MSLPSAPEGSVPEPETPPRPAQPAWLAPPNAVSWQTRAATCLLLGGGAIAIWWPVLGGGALWALPIILLATFIAARGLLPRNRVQLVALSWSWLPWALLSIPLAGGPADLVLPLAWPEAFSYLVDGLRDVAAGTGGPQAVAGWLAIAGACWITGATQSIRVGRTLAASAFLFLAAPFVMAISLSQAADAAWHGAIFLGAALLWATRGGIRAALPAAVVVGLVATATATAIGPTERRVKQLDAGGKSVTLDSRQTYSSDAGNPSGRLMFEVRSPQPALWRMQVLSLWDGRGWEVAAREELREQRAAVPLSTTVSIRALADSRVISGGRVTTVVGGPPTAPGSGESTLYPLPPGEGRSYTSTAEMVRPEIGELQRVPMPSPLDYREETAFYPGLEPKDARPLAEHPELLPPELRAQGWERIFRLARALRPKEDSQLAAVEAVQDYLLDPARFRYSTRTPPPGPQPLVRFLLETRVGYCQHFAGAAALLLRLQGVPVRVATGFATGQSMGGGRYRVTDADAHAWIEVYFAGIGWVPFNPTPPGAAARIGDGVDPLASTAGSGGDVGAQRGALIALGLVALLLAGVVLRRRQALTPPPMREVLVRLVPGAPGPQTTLGEMRPHLAAIGPRTAALLDAEERARFGATPTDGASVHAGAPPTRAPRLRVWRAVVRDRGLLAGTLLMLFGPTERAAAP